MALPTTSLPGNAVAQNVKSNGKEFQEELGLNLYSMDWLSYDPAIGRWTGIDPVTHHDKSPYNAFDNNPVFWADPSGADAIETNKAIQYTGDDAKNYWVALMSTHKTGRSYFRLGEPYRPTYENIFELDNEDKSNAGG